MKKIILAFLFLFFTTLNAQEASQTDDIESESFESKTVETQSFEDEKTNEDEFASDDEEEDEQTNTDPEVFVIPNAPTLRPTNIITVRAIGMGVAPQHATSPAQALALAKRAAIIDGYRQLGEKLHGIKIDARDTIKDAVIKSSVVRTRVHSLVRGADIAQTVYEDGLCQVEMEVKIDGRRWYYALTHTN